MCHLPEWLQEQILDSRAVKALIEFAERISEMYDMRSIGQKFTKGMLLPDNIKSSIEDSRERQAEIAKVADDLVDMNMGYAGLTDATWILPTANSMLGDGDFGGFDGIAVS